MKKLVLIISLFISFQGIAQISHGGRPMSFNKNLSSVVPVYTTPPLSIQKYIDEDAVTDNYKDIAWRFGIEQFVHLNLNNSGVWEILANGDRIWRLKIKSPQAKTINLNYSSFNLPIGATFFVYNKNQVLGSFTHENNKITGEFSTSLLKGDEVILEYFEPYTVQGQGVIEIASVVHGYRDLFNHLKAFGSSGACNINAICDTTLWGNEIRSAVMLLTSGNSRFCSASLINNVLQDGTPYVLSANHCGLATNNIFMFNYQSSNCLTSVDGFTTQTISGCTIRATDTPSDFYLVELSSTPPLSYNVFYAGWSAINVAPTKGTGIHFPALDVKKISHDTDPLVESGYYALGNDHWEVLDWNSGTTEGGSSGSPLFDQNHRVVGQLHGGNAACGNDAQDYYGKFSFSWASNPLSSKQLKFWLDPNNSGVTVLDGYDPSGATLTTDAVLLDISGIEPFVCGDSISPTIIFRNHGAATLSSLTINYELDGGGYTSVNWTGNLSTYAIDSINLPTIYVAGGSHTLTTFCSNPNGSLDNNIANDSAAVNFSSNDQPVISTLYLSTDDYGSETSWSIKDLSGNIVQQSGGYQDILGGQQITESLCLYDSCFTFVLYDSFGDGYCCTYGSGQFQLLNASGDTIAQDYTFTGDSLVFPFCLVTSTNLNTNTQNNFTIYPNPNSGTFNIVFPKAPKESLVIRIYDLVGKLIYYQKTISENNVQINLDNIQKGIYLISVSSNNENIVQKILISQ